MTRDLVIGIDSSTTATKVIAWDAEGRPAGEGRSSIPLSTPAPDAFEQDPADWWRSLCIAMAELGRSVALDRVAAVAVSNQRETFVPLDADGEPLRPAILWLDSRNREDVVLVGRSLGIERFRQITGKTPDPTPCVFGMHWMMRNEPELYRATLRFLEVHGYLVWRLTGLYRTSWASADPTGVFDLEAKAYSGSILDLLQLDARQLAVAERPGTVLGEVTAAATEATGLTPGTLVVAAGGDGQAAGLGTGTLKPGRAYLNLGTASVSGVYSTSYATDPAFRTMASVSGEGYILEICLRTGTFLVDWFVRQILGVDPSADPDVYARLGRAAAELPPGSDGLLLLPHWSGSMTPYWDQDARGLILGLAPEHGQAHLFRAMMEGIALDEAMGLQGIDRVTGHRVEELMAIGGGSRSDLWCRIVADTTGRAVKRLGTAEASSLGAAMAAATGAGWFPTAADAAEAMGGKVEETILPDPARGARYAELLQLYERLYPATAEIQEALAAFRRAAPPPAMEHRS